MNFILIIVLLAELFFSLKCSNFNIQVSRKDSDELCKNESDCKGFEKISDALEFSIKLGRNCTLHLIDDINELFLEKETSSYFFFFKQQENSANLIIIRGNLNHQDKSVKLKFYETFISIKLENYHLILQNVEIEFYFSNNETFYKSSIKALFYSIGNSSIIFKNMGFWSNANQSLYAMNYDLNFLIISQSTSNILCQDSIFNIKTFNLFRNLIIVEDSKADSRRNIIIFKNIHYYSDSINNIASLLDYCYVEIYSCHFQIISVMPRFYFKDSTLLYRNSTIIFHTYNTKLIKDQPVFIKSNYSILIFKETRIYEQTLESSNLNGSSPEYFFIDCLKKNNVIFLKLLLDSLNSRQVIYLYLKNKFLL
jgi:hypothetical protein